MSAPAPWRATNPIRKVGLIATNRLVFDPQGELSSRHRLVVTFLLDLAGYLSVDVRLRVNDGASFDRKRDGACLFRRALAMASRPCLEAVRTGLMRMRDEARSERDIPRSDVLAEFLEEVELRLSLFRDMVVGQRLD
jgi:hypothetical protein